MNTPAVFMNLMNQVFRPLLDHYMIFFIDDLLIYTKNSEEHLKHLAGVLEIL